MTSFALFLVSCLINICNSWHGDNNIPGGDNHQTSLVDTGVSLPLHFISFWPTQQNPGEFIYGSYFLWIHRWLFFPFSPFSPSDLSCSLCPGRVDNLLHCSTFWLRNVSGTMRTNNCVHRKSSSSGWLRKSDCDRRTQILTVSSFVHAPGLLLPFHVLPHFSVLNSDGHFSPDR